MSKDVLHEILSEIHHILSIAESNELIAAASLPSASVYLKEALHALAKERSSSLKEGRIEGTKSNYNNSEKSQSHRSKKSAQKATIIKGPEMGFSQIYQLISISPKLANKTEIKKFASSCGLIVQFVAKDSKKRTAKKLAQAILDESEERRLDLIKILSTDQDTQTQGWIRVIKGSK